MDDLSSMFYHSTENIDINSLFQLSFLKRPFPKSLLKFPLNSPTLQSSKFHFNEPNQTAIKRNKLFYMFASDKQLLLVAKL